MAKFLSAATKYFDMGFNILPLKGYRKNPSLPQWQEYQTRRVTKEEIQAWFSDTEVTGIILVCGKISAVTVVDDDSYHATDKTPISSPWEVSTASGGRHVYFGYTEVSNQHVKTDKHVFEIHNDGVMVVLPPSEVRNKSGEIAKYSWSKASIKDKMFLPKLDITLLPQAEAKPSKNLLELVKAPLGTQHYNLRDIIHHELSRHDPETWDLVVYPNIRRLAQEFVPPHPPERVEKLLADCSTWQLQQRAVSKAPQSLSAIAKLRLENRKLERIAPSTGFRRLDQILKGFVPGHLYTITGHTNIGKTSISANFAHKVATQGKKVLYFALEPADTIIEYIVSVRDQKPFVEITDDDLFKPIPNIDIFTKQQIENLAALLKTIRTLDRYDLVIIDHLGYFIRGENNSVNQEQSNAIKALATLAREKQTAIMSIVHVNKGADDIPSMKDISGSAALYQDSTEVMIVIREVDEVASDKYQNVFSDRGRIIVTKTKAGKAGTAEVFFKPDSAYMYEEDDMRTIVQTHLF